MDHPDGSDGQVTRSEKLYWMFVAGNNGEGDDNRPGRTPWASLQERQISFSVHIYALAFFTSPRTGQYLRR